MNIASSETPASVREAWLVAGVCLAGIYTKESPATVVWRSLCACPQTRGCSRCGRAAGWMIGISAQPHDTILVLLLGLLSLVAAGVPDTPAIRECTGGLAGCPGARGGAGIITRSGRTRRLSASVREASLGSPGGGWAGGWAWWPSAAGLYELWRTDGPHFWVDEMRAKFQPLHSSR